MKNLADVLEDQWETQEKTDKNDHEHRFVKIWKDQNSVHQAESDIEATVDILV